METKTTGAWRISKASVELPSGADAPTLTLAPQPTQAKAPAPDSFVLVRFDINEKGLPINIQVDKSSDKELEGEVITLIRGWRFEAALRGDVPFVVATRIYRTFSKCGSLPRTAALGQYTGKQQSSEDLTNFTAMDLLRF